MTINSVQKSRRKLVFIVVICVKQKVSRASLTRGGSQEDPQQLLRDLHDSLEREADLREQLRFAEEEVSWWVCDVGLSTSSLYWEGFFYTKFYRLSNFLLYFLQFILEFIFCECTFLLLGISMMKGADELHYQFHSQNFSFCQVFVWAKTYLFNH